MAASPSSLMARYAADCHCRSPGCSPTARPPQVAAALEHLSAQVRALGSPLPAPFATLSFLALSVIPAARVTDQGFVAL